ncbi:MAG: M1 family peptidase, partial [Bacteroidia bacterium]|nr:M1 family peptidase [Bacteroidia bacterium]
MKSIRSLILLLAISGIQVLYSQNTNQNTFKQLDDELPTPNVYRTASGAPGHEYWQQKADYDIKIELDDFNQKLFGFEKITYHNNSPDQLNYLWLQLDQNVRAQDSDRYKISSSSISEKMTASQISG